MIPLELTIEGLYSYQKRQTIDFTKLTNAGLFGIFGSVGSGKSSILEAITYALYGKTDKLNQSGDNRNYNMMNLKSNELFIDFIFQTGKDQTIYRSIVKGRRNSKRFEDVKTFERKSYNKIKNEWIPIEVSELEKAVGLSYQNFKRTIIIPQGQFQEFLQLGNRDRTQMMKELFNLQKFEFYYKVVSLETKNNSKIQNVGGQLQQLGTIDPHKVYVYSKQLKELEDNIKAQNLKLNTSQKAEEQLRNLNEDIKKRDESEKELNSLLQQQPQYDKLENRVRRYEQSVVDFKYILTSLKDYRSKVKDRGEQIFNDEVKLKADNESIDKLVEVVENLKSKYEKREELKRKSIELNTLISIKKLEEDVEKETTSVDKGNKYWLETNAIVSDLKIERDNLESNLNRLRTSMPDFSLLTIIKAWYTEKHNLDSYHNDIKNQIKTCSEKEKELLSHKENLLKDQLFKGSSTLNFNECFQLLDSEISKIKNQQTELLEHESHIMAKAKLEAYANNLQANSPCPLCGSLHHPILFKSEDLKEFQEQIKSKKTLLEKQHQSASSINKDLSILEAGYIDLKKRTDELMVLNDEQISKITNHSKLFIWDKYLTLEDLNNAFDEMAIIHSKIKDCEAALTQKTKDLKGQEINLERAKIKLDEINKSLTIHKTQLLTLHQQLQIVNPLDYADYNQNTIIKEREIILSEYTRIEKDYNLNFDQLHKKNRERDLLKGRIETNITELNNELLSIKNLEKEVDRLLAKSEFTSIEEIQSILSETIDIRVEKLRIEEFKNSLLTCRSTLKQYQSKIGDSKYDIEYHVQLIKEIDEIKSLVSQMSEERGQINELHYSLLKNIETQLSLRKDLEALETRSDNIKTMKSLFKASGFVNYISSKYLHNLCNSANSRFFQLTRQKLSLEIAEDNNFRVRDYMNGGKERSVKTLSGGQTFQASLSLALALADNIQKITESNQNFFFLDEGFGSLDKESLDIVFDTLKSLRKENRIVGVISHVEEMQQEIETHLYINNHEEKGSIIHPSWSNNY